MFGNLGDPKHLGQQLASILVENNPAGYLPEDACSQLQAATQRIIRGLGNESMEANLKQEFMIQVMSAAFERLATRRGVVGSHSGIRFTPASMTSPGLSTPESVSNARYPKEPLNVVNPDEISERIYQTGERIPLSGIYDVVGANLGGVSQQKTKSSRILYIGEDFPVYRGEEVCWHFISPEANDGG